MCAADEQAGGQTAEAAADAPAYKESYQRRQHGDYCGKAVFEQGETAAEQAPGTCREPDDARLIVGAAAGGIIAVHIPDPAVLQNDVPKTAVFQILIHKTDVVIGVDI